MTSWLLLLYWCANAMATSCVPVFVPGAWSDEAVCHSNGELLKTKSPRLDAYLCLPMTGRDLTR